jgi:hypothetical protein
LLVRLVLSLDPDSDAARGLDDKVFASMGIDVEGLAPKEKMLRTKLRAKIRSEFLPYEDFRDLPGRIPGLGPPASEASGPIVLIPWAGLSMVVEKIARGCEYRYRNRKRYVERPYEILTLIPNSEQSTHPLATNMESLDFGPGFNVRRWSAPEDPGVVGYWISIWGTLHLAVAIDFEEEIAEMKKRLPKPGGVLPPDDRAMTVPDYLRKFEH